MINDSHSQKQINYGNCRSSGPGQKVRIIIVLHAGVAARVLRRTCVSHGTGSQLTIAGLPVGVGNDPFTHGSTSVMFVIDRFPDLFVLTS